MSAVSEALSAVIQEPITSDEEATSPALSPEAREEVQRLVAAQLAPFRAQIGECRLSLDAQRKYADRLRKRIVELEGAVGTLVARAQLEDLQRQFASLPAQVQEQEDLQRQFARFPAQVQERGDLRGRARPLRRNDLSGSYRSLPRPRGGSSSTR